jgi:two-component system chemotaxis response regulator CheB
MKPVRVLVVDDSLTMRSLIRATLHRDPGVEVVGQAGDALEARAAIKALNPDVITLDVEMPNMNGLEFLEKIMRLRPTPVIMVSSLTNRGADAAIKAFELGAVDCVAKPSVGGLEAFDELAAKVKIAARARLQNSPSQRSVTAASTPAPHADAPYESDGRVLAIGSSTGGVEALISILTQFPANCPPTVITQHMPATFTKRFAERLARLCAPKVDEAVEGAPLEIGQIYVAPGSTAHLQVAGHKRALHCRLSEAGPVNGHRPSVDMLFNSVAQVAGSNAVGVILTGMGRDGATGLLAIRQKGGATLGQDEASCLVYGMPKAAFELGGVERQLPLNRIGREILNVTSAKKEA